MAEVTKEVTVKGTVEEPDEKVKTKQVEIVKFHPLVAHEVGEQPFLEEGTAAQLIKIGYAKAIK